ncbi:MAG: hypothetical protein ACPL7R_09125 [Anaerolineae bacterium]
MASVQEALRMLQAHARPGTVNGMVRGGGLSFADGQQVVLFPKGTLGSAGRRKCTWRLMAPPIPDR